MRLTRDISEFLDAHQEEALELLMKLARFQPLPTMRSCGLPSAGTGWSGRGPRAFIWMRP